MTDAQITYIKSLTAKELLISFLKLRDQGKVTKEQWHEWQKVWAEKHHDKKRSHTS